MPRGVFARCDQCGKTEPFPENAEFPMDDWVPIGWHENMQFPEGSPSPDGSGDPNVVETLFCSDTCASLYYANRAGLLVSRPQTAKTTLSPSPAQGPDLWDRFFGPKPPAAQPITSDQIDEEAFLRE